ncbi:hypothetical protein BC937DRAFT_91261 [Endogone sp. FLAS-F59071]|nr:hypothetical protein BC937DRAFT_91261 [Endogone sp. FLAS-F59071]|eukprot:RUS16398.1 hypothetical protein BC937DRAFT_91261 [Endogone sp. FLAS-F59071]
MIASCDEEIPLSLQLHKRPDEIPVKDAKGTAYHSWLLLNRKVIAAAHHYQSYYKHIMESTKSNFSGGYALVIGTGADIKGSINSKYQSTINDAEWIAQVLKEPSLCAFPDNQVKLLVGKDATRKRISAELASLEELVTDNENTTVVVFFSGHGLRFENKTYLIPYGYEIGQTPQDHAIDGNLLYTQLKLTGADRTLLLLNCCHAGGAVSKLGKYDEDDDQSKVLLGPLTETQIKRLSKGEGFALLSSSRPSQASETGYLPSNSRKRYSPFTIGLSRGFAGKNKDDSDGLVYFRDLVTEVTTYVSQTTKNRQIPHFDFKGDNFAVGLHKEGAANVGKFPLLSDSLVFDIESTEDGEEEDVRKVIRGIQNTNTNSVTVNGPINLTNGHAIIGVSFGDRPIISYNADR